MEERMYKVFGKINYKCLDGRTADSIENALIKFKKLTNNTENIVISVAQLNDNTWYILSDQELEIAKHLAETIFDQNIKFTKYAPSSIRLAKNK